MALSYRLQQKLITDYNTFITNYKNKFRNYIKNLLQIMAAQISTNYWRLLQIALIFITKQDCSQNYYKSHYKSF